ncbi:MAG: phosphatase PAP2 family protein [Caldimonas sp.]
MRGIAVLAAVVLSSYGPAVAQGPAPVSGWMGGPEPFVRRDVRTGDAFLVLGTTAGLMLIDRPAQQFLQAHRSKTLDRLASVFRPMGTLVGYGGVTAGVLAAGLVSGDDDVKRAGGRLALGAISTLITDGIVKRLAGRARPDANEGPWDFDPMRRHQVSFVSGHAAEAFALATAISDDLHNTWASIAVYTFAAGTSWSRLNDDRHWSSDVFGGAMLGITTAKVINGRWEVLDITPPRFLLDPEARAAVTPR